MRRLFYIALSLAVLLGVTATRTHADSPLPQADWYAVAWARSTDTLHWINPAGEQANIVRPKLPGETGDLDQTRLHIGVNGRQLVILAPLANGRQGIGFYDLGSGQLLTMHESAPNEVFLEGTGISNLSGTRYAAALRNMVTGDWRIIVFDLQTGNALNQLTSSGPNLPPMISISPDWWPYLVELGIDEGLGQSYVRFQMVTSPVEMQLTFPSFRWFPDSDATSSTDSVFFSRLAGFDILPTTGQIVYAWHDDQFGPAQAPTSTTSISTQAHSAAASQLLVANQADRPNAPQWLRGGTWISYRVQNQVFEPHYTIMTADGSGSVPLGPNFGAIYDTPDGYLAEDGQTWQLFHVTEFEVEAFASAFDSLIFDPGVPYSVIYTSPYAGAFTLTNLAVPLVTPGDVAPPPVNPSPTQPPVVAVDCSGAPPARLTVGGMARATFSNGVPLNVRSLPSGALVTQIAEGTVFEVIGGPQCSGGYLWWNIRLQGGTIGWAAEGEPGIYYIEPWDGLPVAPPPAVPTATPLNVAPPQQAPTATLGFVIAANCPNSPPTKLAIGMAASVVDNGGTLAVYAAPNSGTPDHQLAANTAVSVIGGPACRDNGARVWQISTAAGGGVTGWVTEGFGQAYFLLPK